MEQEGRAEEEVFTYTYRADDDLDIMPRVLWHNVHMNEAATSPMDVKSFQFDWQSVEKGVPLSALEGFTAHSGFAVRDWLDVVIPARTLKHRRKRKEPLNLDESDRLVRLVRLYDLSVRVFGDAQKARHWLLGPKHRFDNRSPLSMMRTETGGRQVEEWLIQIDEGMFA